MTVWGGLQDWLDANPEATRFPPEFDACIEGLCLRFNAPPVLVYSFERVLAQLMREGMDRADAQAFFEVEMLTTDLGERTPVFIRHFEEKSAP